MTMTTLPTAEIRLQPGVESDIRPATPPPSCVIVIFGASGDLARRELFPSLYELHRQDLLPASYAIVGVAPRDWSLAEFRERVRAGVTEHCEGEVVEWEGFAQRLSFVRGDARSPPGQDYAALADAIEAYAAQPELLAAHGRAGRAQAERYYSIETMVAQYSRLYRALQNNKSNFRESIASCVE